jgi:hypothetical protein
LTFTISAEPGPVVAGILAVIVTGVSLVACVGLADKVSVLSALAGAAATVASESPDMSATAARRSATPQKLIRFPCIQG